MAESSLPGRAVTSALSSENSSELKQQSDPHTSVDPRFDRRFFIPHVYDFVSILKPADFHGVFQIPSLYLEPLAVDQSTVIGHGASFTTFKTAIPATPARSVTSEWNGSLVIVSESQESQVRHLVYKVARIAFTETGTPTPRTRHAMKAALMELYCLVHEPLREHPNIINLLGVAWGSNYFDPSHRLPVLVVEYADHGTLAQLQEKKDLGPDIRHCLAVNIGEGLKMLHRCGIIHGDVKSENILIFAHSEREFIAKLSDFGFSVIGEAASAEVDVGGTRPWKAPEAKSAVPKHLLQATDIYSYGLLLWRLATDGKDPFCFWVSSNLRGEAYLEELERIKEDDQPIRNTSLDVWFVPYILKKSLNFCLRPPQAFQVASGPFLSLAQQNSFYGRISPALEKCLSVNPTQRDLHEAVDLLTGDDHSYLGPTTTNGDDILLRMSYDHHILSWQQMRQLPPGVQSFVFSCFRAKVQEALSNQYINPPDCFVLASYYINGYGTEVNFEEARRLIERSSSTYLDHHSSRTYAFRIWKSLDPNYVPTTAMISNLAVMAVRGSRMAAIDLKEVAPEEYFEVESLIRDVHAGVGADFFYDEQMLGGFSYWQWVRTFDNQEILVRNLSTLNCIAEYKVNKRGDGILHMAASAGRIRAIETLLEAFSALTINQHNERGESPLLCACRAGQRTTVLRLLELGADASIVAPNGESCLHWLVTFNDDDIYAIGEALIRRGAELRVFTRERIAYSQLRATIDVDFQLPGTPLNWAVHHDRPCIIKFILEKASDPSVCLDWPTDLLGKSSPLEYAAFFHHVECLELMTDTLDQAEVVYSLAPILAAGTNAADTFSMILRHGAKFEENLHKFLDFGLRKSSNVIFATGVGGFDTHLLYYAVSEGHDKVVEYLLSSEVRQLVQSFNIEPREAHSDLGVYSVSDINRPAGGDCRTPVLEAIRWNRKLIVELLVANGADPKAASKNPFSATEVNWTGLHILAAAGHYTEQSELVAFLIEAGLLIDGILNIEGGSHNPAETPFLVAVQHNAFDLATTFLEFGADPNALRLSSGLLSLERPTTVLGHIIASSSQHTIPRLRYLLERCPKNKTIDFIVEPARQLSALHRAAWAHQGILHRSPDHSRTGYLCRDDYDLVVNRGIIQELLEKWGYAGEHLNRRCKIHGRTALHLAVEAGNIQGVELLLEKEADASLCDDLGLTPTELAEELFNGVCDDISEAQDSYAAIIKMLLKKQHTNQRLHSTKGV